MAITKLGELVAGIRGTIGGVIYSANKAGTFVRRWSRGTNPRTNRQSVERGALALFAASWGELTQGERDDWDTYAALIAQVKENALGDAYYASGFNWYIAINCQLASVGRAARDTFPPGARPTAPDINAYHLSDGTPPLTNITYDDGTFTQTGGGAEESEKSVGAGASTAPGTAWTNPGNIVADDAALATVIVAGYAWSEYLEGTQCGFAIPGTATITGIKLYNKHTPAAVTIREIQPLKAGTRVGTPKSTLGTLAGGYREWGGIADMWGTTWTPAEINASGFGMSWRINGGMMGAADNVDHFKIRVYYTTALVGTDYDMVIFQSQATTAGPQVRTSKFWLVHGTQTPDDTQEFFQDGVLAAFGEPDVGWKGFVSVHRQSDDGQRSAPTSLNDLVT